MAKPQYHVVPAAICAYLGYQLGGGWPEAIAASFSGFFLDVDHLSIRRIKNILNGRRKDFVPGWVDYFHTRKAALIFLVAAIFTNWWFALASYAIHMLIDGGNKENLASHEAPLPEAMFKFYPPRLTYRSGL